LVYKIQDKLNEEEFMPYFTEDDKEELLKLTATFDDWLYSPEA
jgi:hypothetical protein